MSNQNAPKNALFVCFGAMSNTGALSGLAAMEAVKRLQPGTAGIFCLAGLATEAKNVIEKTRAAQRLITVDGCPLNCAQKLVEQSGYIPDVRVTLVKDAEIVKRPWSGEAIDEQELQRAVEAILAAVESA